MEKILSLIIPTYNMEKYLNKCLDSLITENMDLYEVLVIIDGSKDRSSEIAHNYEKKYPNTFRVIDKENGNYGSCINRGLKESKGKYVKVLDADDYFCNTAFSQYILFLKDQDNDLVLNDCIRINENGEYIDLFNFKKINIKSTISFKEFASKQIFPQMHCVAYKKDKICSINYKQTEGISYTDQEWVSIPMQNIESIIYINLPLYNYLIGREGQTMDPQIMLRSFKHQAIVALSIINCSTKFEGDDVHKKYLMTKAVNFLRYLYNEHLIHESYDNKEFKTFDEHLFNNYPTYIDNFSNSILGKAIKYWRITKSYPVYIKLYIWLKKKIKK